LESGVSATDLILLLASRQNLNDNTPVSGSPGPEYSDIVFWVVTIYNVLVNIAVWKEHAAPFSESKHVFPKQFYSSKKLHGVTAQKTKIWIWHCFIDFNYQAKY
jgi:hypothetical protein